VIFRRFIGIILSFLPSNNIFLSLRLYTFFHICMLYLSIDELVFSSLTFHSKLVVRCLCSNYKTNSPPFN